MKVFIIPGYGIPESIERDRNYLTYLHVAFNRIYDSAKGEKALIIPCGGPTNCTAPYDGTEAAMIGGYIQKLINRPMMGDRCKDWSIVLEDRSISTLENLVFAKEILVGFQGVQDAVIFCDATRLNRIQQLSDRVFGSSVPIHVEAIDFDISANRYLADDILEEREREALKNALAAFESPERFAKEHELFERKLVLLRSLQDGGMSHVDAVVEWYRQAPSIIAELMLD
ncbi:MAG: ElyC/SanA/YdcF family protein [Patescibacteria group bacterium]